VPWLGFDWMRRNEGPAIGLADGGAFIVFEETN
jgi:hypothetical protein